MSVVAAAIIGSTVVGVVGSAVTAKSASKAADVQEQAAKDSNAIQDKQIVLQKEMYDQTRKDQEPWRQAGVNALTNITNGMKDGGEFSQKFSDTQFAGDPGYKFRLAEGQNALDNMGSAAGSYLSGNQLRAASQYNQNFASNEYGNAYNRFMNDQTSRFNRQATVAGVGQTANNALANAGSNYVTAGANSANAVSNNLAGAANAKASSYVATGNAVNNALSQVTNGYMNYKAYQSLPSPNQGIT